jgi:hypothetical protein
MSNRIIVACILWISILTAAFVAGCSQGEPEVRGASETRAGGILHDGFRIRRDPMRNRIWLLGLDAVSIYDGQSKRLIRSIKLPGWSVARFACDPDIVLDRSGSAIVSSNVQPRLWRIDAASFEVSEHPVKLEGRERWDVGFGALVVARDGTLLALTSVSESYWSIDLDRGTARMVAPGTVPMSICGVNIPPSGNAGSTLDAFTNFVPAIESDYAVGAAVTDAPPIAGRLHIASQRRSQP